MERGTAPADLMKDLDVIPKIVTIMALLAPTVACKHPPARCVSVRLVKFFWLTIQKLASIWMSANSLALVRNRAEIPRPHSSAPAPRATFWKKINTLARPSIPAALFCSFPIVDRCWFPI